MWPWRKTEQRSVSIADPVLAEFFGVGNRSYAGVTVSESSALGLSGVWRACMLVSGTIASLPMRTLRDTADGRRERVGSFLDDPGGPDGLTPFEWKETVLLHQLLHGETFLAHVFNGGGGLAALAPIHPLAVGVEWERDENGKATGRKQFTVTLDDGTTRVFNQDTMTQVMGPSLDGLRGLSVIGVARNSLGTAIAGDRAAARQFASGLMIAGLVTPEEDVTEAEGKVIKEGLQSKVSGVDNAGEIAFINRKLKLTPWTMSNEDAQFLQSREFSIEEIARWFGVPPFELMQTSKQTSWGTGVESRQRGMARTVLAPWAIRLEQRLSRLLPKPRFVEFDFAGLERPTPEQEIELLIKQVDAGLITVDEARHIRNMEPLPAPAPEPEEPAA